ncbi:MAG: recombinase family protein [bacterium]
MSEVVHKVTAEHLARKAYLYIRQSSLKQVWENTESTKRQYGLRQRALTLGWSDDQIVVIDNDLGKSAAPGAADRAGFERLVADVGMGRAGIVMGLEVSRLARSSSAWHRLLEICAVTGTLVLDQDGLYDPKKFNDRLLLGLKAAMSEAELHVIRERMRGGALSKASRGELRTRLAVGYVYNARGEVVSDPDRQVQEAIRLFFNTFQRLGSAYKTAQYFQQEGLKFPKRMHCGPNKGELVWGELTTGRVPYLLHSPRYAGAYVYGQFRAVRGPDGRVQRQECGREQWHTLILDAHEGYISWDQYERNRKWLDRNLQARHQKRKCPPREGMALLQGLAVCGLCGRHMTVRYHHRRGRITPEYVCPGLSNTIAGPKCQTMPGDKIDESIGALLMEVMTPVALEVSLVVQEEVQKRFDEADKLRLREVDRARYDADLAKRRYLKVDPDNRLVAETLEVEWNVKLRHLHESEEEYKRRRESDRLIIGEEQREKIMSLAKNFPELWRNPKTPQRERKRMIGLLIEDVTLVKTDGIKASVRFKGGATRELALPRPLLPWEEKKTDDKVLAGIDRLLDDHTCDEIASILDGRGLTTGGGKHLNGYEVRRIVRRYNLKNRRERLRDKGLLTLDETAERLRFHKGTLKRKRNEGALELIAHKVNDLGEYMYEPPPPEWTGKPGRCVSSDRQGAV